MSFHEDLKTDDWVRYYAASDCVGCNPVEVSKAAKARIAELEAIIATAGALTSQKASHDMIIDALCGRLNSQSK